MARMEDVLNLYEGEYNNERPVVRFDETSRQLVRDILPAIGAVPGRVQRYDYEYERNGTRNLFVFCEPKGGWRHVEVTQRRTAVDFADQMRWLVDEAYPEVGTIRLVLDNLNIHKFGSLYEAFEPSEARRMARRLELHHTPKPRKLAEHGRDRVGHLQQVVPEASNRGRTDPDTGDRVS